MQKEKLIQLSFGVEMSFRVFQIKPTGSWALSPYFSILLAVECLLGFGVTLDKVILETESKSNKGSSCESGTE